MAAVLAGVALAAAAAASSSEEPELRFVEEGWDRSVSLAELRSRCEPRRVEVDDPYHGRRMEYVGLALRCVLDVGFAARGGAASIEGEGLLLRALDGYTRPASGRVLLEPGAILAYGEPGRMDGAEGGSAFSRIDRRQVDPAPFYLVWTGREASDPHRRPWPYQLATIEIAPFEAAFPHTVPRGLPDEDPGWDGYALFQRACASCHAINGEGGRVGPDLNVPRSIVEYRPVEQIKAYVRDPQSFRYTSMPAHPGLEESDLDALIAYFRAMSQRKHDPARESASDATGGGPS